MFFLKTAQTTMTILLLIIAYAVTLTLGNFVRAWAAVKMGDENPEHEGRLTLNPLEQIDPLGLFFLVLTGICWGRYIPLNPYAFFTSYFPLRVVFAFFAEVFFYGALSLCSLLLVLYMYGNSMLYVAIPTLFAGKIHFAAFYELFPASSSLLSALTFIVILTMYVSSVWAIITFLRNLFEVIMIFALPDLYRENRELVIFGPLVFMILCACTLQYHLGYFLLRCGIFFSTLFGW